MSDSKQAVAVDPRASRQQPAPAPAGSNVPFSAYQQPFDLEDNPWGDGIYRLTSPDKVGTFANIPYRNIPEAIKRGYGFSDNDNLMRYMENRRVDPHKGPDPYADWSFGDKMILDSLQPSKEYGRSHPIAGFMREVGGGVVNPLAQLVTHPKQVARGLKQTATDLGAIVDHFQGEDFLRTPEQRADAKQAYDLAMEHVHDMVQEIHDHPGELVGNFIGGELTGEVIGKPLSYVGKKMVRSGAKAADRYLNGGRPLPVTIEGTPKFGSPGGATLESGPTDFVSKDRQISVAKANRALQAAGSEVERGIQAAKPRISIADLRDAIDNVLNDKRATIGGPFGNKAWLTKLDEIRDSFGPVLKYNGTVSAEAVWDALKQADKNISWESDASELGSVPTDAKREIRGAISDLMKKASPETAESIQRYRDLADARELAFRNQYASGTPSAGGKLAGDATTAAAGGMFGGPVGGAATGVGAHGIQSFWESPGLVTLRATGLYQAGKAMEAAGSKLEALPQGVRNLAGAGAGITMLSLPDPIANARYRVDQNVPADPDDRKSETDLETETHDGPPSGSSSMISPTAGQTRTSGQRSAKTGRAGWIEGGAKNLSALGIAPETIEALRSSPQGQQILIEAHEVSAGSKRMKAILSRVDRFR